ncbi:UvrD-helicase domain-containing protein, partial [Rhodopirellula sp.]
MKLTEKLLLQIHRLRISTLDSLFTQLAKSFPFDLRLPAAWRLTDEIEDQWLRERAVESMISQLEQAEMSSLMSMLGKGEIRRSIAHELLQVIENAYSMQRQCEKDVWLGVKCPKQPSEETIRNAVVAFRSAEPRQKRLRQKLLAFAEILENGDHESLIEETLVTNYEIARRTGTPLTYYRSEFPDGLEAAFDTLYSVAKVKHLSLLCVQNEGTGRLLEVYEQHVSGLTEVARVLSFEDIGVRLSSFFRQFEPGEILQRLDGSIDHLLLDEFQDTSPVQWQVIYPFANHCAKRCEGKPSDDSELMQVERSFFCVGDTKQAIYGWRGGVAEIFDTVAQQLPDVDEIKQDESHRSSPVLMEAFNRIFKNLARHPMAEEAEQNNPSGKSMYEAKALLKFADGFPHHLSAKKDLSGYVNLSTSSLPELGDADARRIATYEKAAEQIQTLYQKNSTTTIGVLTRTNRAVAEMIYLLEQRGLDVSQEGGNPLTDSAAVEMVLSVLMMSEHPGDRRWEFHATAGPFYEIEGFGPGWVRRLVEEFGLTEAVEKLADRLSPHCDERESLRLKQLCYLAIQYQGLSSSRIRDFVRMVREKRVDRPQAAPIRVMTVHQSKGLEFDAVFVLELDSSLSRQAGDCVGEVKDLMMPPSGMTRYVSQKTWHFLSRDWQKTFGKQAASSFTESLCMLYVALTRAKRGLYMVIPPAKKQAYDTRTFGSLIFHALRVEEDPTSENSVLFEMGDPDWPDSLERPAVSESERQAAPEAIV